MSQNCPKCGFAITNCPSCGYATIFFPRHGPRGQGAHYAARIARLTRIHELALEVLRGKNAIDFERGLGLTEVWMQIREICLAKHLRVPTKQGVSGRLSELAGLGMVKTEHNKILLVDGDTMQFRDREKSRWYLVSDAKPRTET